MTRTPEQLHTLEKILGVGQDRPVADSGIAQELHDKIYQGTSEALGRWKENSLFLSKSQLGQVLRCEGNYKATKEAPRIKGVLLPVAAGTIIHRAIQHNYTHPQVPTPVSVKEAVTHESKQNPEFDLFWVGLGTAEQSDFLGTCVAAVTTFLDSWPMLEDTWTPRFEFGMQARIGKVTLSGRPDLVLGRPRADWRQSMVIADWKSGGIYEEHEHEADFYALISTLRFKVPPYRSFIYSLAAAETTTLDVTPERLHKTADTLIGAINNIVEVMNNEREPALTPGSACGWCPAKDTCPAFALAQQ